MLENLKYWHWVIIGTIFGALLGYARISKAQPELRTMTQAEFESKITQGKQGNFLVLTDVQVRPDWNLGYVVTGKQFLTYLQRSLYEPFECDVAKPFVPTSVHDPVDFGQFLATAAQRNPDFVCTYDWWAGQTGIMLKFTGGGLLVGMIWPIGMQLMIAGRLAAREREKFLDLKQLSHSPVVKPVKLQPTAEQANQLDSLLGYLQNAGSVGVSVSDTKASTAQETLVPVKLSGADSVKSVDQTEEEKHFGGSFYPTEVHREDENS